MKKTLLSYTDIRRQSNAVYAQFGESTWKPNARINAGLRRCDTNALQNSGIGRVLVSAAMGESTEEAIPVLAKYREKFDLIVNDKAFGYFVDRGITPDYVMLCDAGIRYDWIAKYVDKTEGVKLIATPYANPEWTKAWKGDRYFYIPEDSIDSHMGFLDIMGRETRIVPAASNVSNAMLVFFVGATNQGNINWAGYDRYLLTGYDYSWRPSVAAAGIKTGKYYAFEDPKPKRFYMNHRTIMDVNRDWVHTSENLLFSAKWLISYLNAFHPPVVNCSGRGLLDIPSRDSLEEQLRVVNASRGTRESVRGQFNAVALASQLLAETKANFDRAREAIYAG